MIHKILHKRIRAFDEVTRFRLTNSYLVAIGMNLFWPIAVVLKGIYLLPAVIAGFMIAETLMIKTNRYMVENYTLEQIFRLGVFMHFLFTITALLYFISPFYMILLDSSLAIIDIVVFSAYSIMLTNYLTKNYPESMNEFQLTRNGVWADGTLIGLICISIITYFFSIEVGLVIFAIYNMFFSLWLLSHWNFFKKISNI